jgi:hypothetical protein
MSTDVVTAGSVLALANFETIKTVVTFGAGDLTPEFFILKTLGVVLAFLAARPCSRPSTQTNAGAVSFVAAGTLRKYDEHLFPWENWNKRIFTVRAIAPLATAQSKLAEGASWKHHGLDHLRRLLRCNLRNSHAGPCHPGAQVHRPDFESHVPLCIHRQCFMQLGP